MMKQLVRNALRWAGYSVEGIRYTPRQLLESSYIRQLEFDDIICRHMFDSGPTCSFIQVGAFDGVSTDPIKKYINKCGWRGVMIEPQPGPANQLRELYRVNPNVVVLEAAVDRERKRRSLYTVASKDVPRWALGMASFDRNHILKHDYLIPGIERLVLELVVDCVPFDHVVDMLSSERLDLLQIDAEGADGYLISLFPFDRIYPAIVHWEIKNMTRVQQEQVLETLIGHGYRISRSGAEDMVAVRVS